MDKSRDRAVLMRRVSFGRYWTVALAAGLAGSVVEAQVPPRDTIRRAPADSARVSAPSQRPALATPSMDLARTVDAEVRIATFELVSGDDVAALSRLDRLSTLVRQDSSGAPAPERAAMHFVLAQSYYRVGLLAPFRREAEASLAAAPTRYASVLRPQLLLEAYRSGDYERATTLARDLPPNEAGLAALVAGLSAYQTGDLVAARNGFQRAAAAGGELSTYAKYMDAVTQLRADTLQAAAVVSTLESVAAGASGTFADQVRLTAAQVAYEGQRFDDAVRLASTIADSSAVAAPALLTRAWALYKLDRVDDAERAFADFVARYPNRLERDEARLMMAQAQLELGRSDEAERVFQRVADSASIEATALRTQSAAAMNNVARALVSNRVSELLTIDDPAGAKALMVRDSSGTDAVLAAIAGETVVPTGTVRPILGTAAAGQRLDSFVAGQSPTVTRVLFAPAPPTSDSRALIAGSQRLTEVDASVAVARLWLRDQIAAQQREIELLVQLGASVAADSAGIAGLGANNRALADSLARLDQMLAAAEARLRGMLGQEVEATRLLAAENARTADSLSRALGASAEPEDREALATEVAIAASYTRIAETVSGGLDRAIANHPTFQLRDSIRVRNSRSLVSFGQLQGVFLGSRRAIDDALRALRSGDSPATSAARKALSDAEAQRTSVEAQVIAAVSSELSARATAMLAGLQHSAEAAQFGTASAAFFRAIDGTRAVGGAGTVDEPRRPAPEQRR